MTKKKTSEKFNTAYVLLDRTGSMSSLWDEAVGSINAYLDKLEDDVKVYLACFDSESFDVLREDVKKKVKKLKKDEVEPRACTPLYDSAAKVMNKMLADKPERAVFVVMTDGYENASKEYTLDQVKKLMKKIEKKNWPSVMLGADFKEVEAYATHTFGYNQANTVSSARGNMGQTMNLVGLKTTAYFKGDNTAMAWTQAEKDSVKEEKTK